jgi:hypothetical protein
MVFGIFNHNVHKGGTKDLRLVHYYYFNALPVEVLAELRR